MADEEKERPVHPLTLLVSALGAVTGAFVGSFIGDRGTMFGLFIGSVLSNGATSLYAFYLKKAHAKAEALRKRQFGDWRTPKLNWKKWAVSTLGLAAATSVVILVFLTVGEKASGTTLHGAVTSTHDRGTTLGGSTESTSTPTPTNSPTRSTTSVTPSASVTPTANLQSPTATPSSATVTPTTTLSPTVAATPTQASQAPQSPAPLTPTQTGAPIP